MRLLGAFHAQLLPIPSLAPCSHLIGPHLGCILQLLPAFFTQQGLQAGPEGFFKGCIIQWQCGRQFNAPTRFKVVATLCVYHPLFTDHSACLFIRFIFAGRIQDVI